MRALTARGARDLLRDRRGDRPRASRARTTRRARPRDQRASLLTPVAKAFSTDIGTEVASLGVQVHGGMGFIEETGAAQHYRDARIAQIYEGTNGIQAIDLVTRKLPMMGGAVVRGYLDELRHTVAAVKATNDPAFGATGARLVRRGRQPRPRHHVAARQARQVARRGARRRDALSAAVRVRGRRLRARRGRARREPPQWRRRRRPRRARALLRREHRRAGGRAGNHRHRRRGFGFSRRAARRGVKEQPMTNNVIVTDEGPVRTHPHEPAGEEERAHLRDVRRDGARRSRPRAATRRSAAS